MKQTVVLLFFLLFGMRGLLLGKQETPLVSSPLGDSLALHLRMAERYSRNTRTCNFSTARRHAARCLALADSLHLSTPLYLEAAAGVEHLAFEYERNKPASGGKTDLAACLAAAAACYDYNRQAYLHYAALDTPTAKTAKRQQALAAQAMHYFLLTDGFRTNARQAFQNHRHTEALRYFERAYQGAITDFPAVVYHKAPVRYAAFATFLTDSTREQLLFHCATLATAADLPHTALAYYDSLKRHHAAPEKVYPHTVTLAAQLRDTMLWLHELDEAINALPTTLVYQKQRLQITLDRHEWAHATVLADAILRADSTDAPTLALRGGLYETAGLTDSALCFYRQAFCLDTTQAFLPASIARIYYNRALTLNSTLYKAGHDRNAAQREIRALHEAALPWLERVCASDTAYTNTPAARCLREVLYQRFTQNRCKNRAALIAHYNDISRRYRLPLFGNK